MDNKGDRAKLHLNLDANGANPVPPPGAELLAAPLDTNLNVDLQGDQLVSYLTDQLQKLEMKCEAYEDEKRNREKREEEAKASQRNREASLVLVAELENYKAQVKELKKRLADSDGFENSPK